jgi:hypothetical protein
MLQKDKVWFVDDLPRNLEKFKRNHGEYFDVELFADPAAVLQRIHNKEYPDALLCDVFFYDTVAEAERVEKKIDELAVALRKTANEIGVHDHRHAAGITLMRNIYEHFNNQPPHFPMYAYTSKGPFLLEQNEWENISKYGAQVLLKGRVTADIERTEIAGDIAMHKAKNSWLGWINTTSRKIALALIPGLFVFFIGAWLRGHW